MKEFTNQFGDTVREITLNSTSFSIEIIEDQDVQEEINEDFFFRYGKTETSEKAFNILTK